MLWPNILLKRDWLLNRGLGVIWWQNLNSLNHCLLHGWIRAINTQIWWSVPKNYVHIMLQYAVNWADWACETIIWPCNPSNLLHFKINRILLLREAAGSFVLLSALYIYYVSNEITSLMRHYDTLIFLCE